MPFLVDPSAVVKITPVFPKGPTVTFGLLGDSTYQNAVGGTGGIQIVDIPRQAAVTQWYDRPPYQLDLPLRLDSALTATEGTSCELACAAVESWQDRAPGSDQIPVLQVKGPVPGLQRLWFVYTMSMGKAIRNAQSGYRSQQDINLSLYEYLPPAANILKSPSPAAAAAQALSATYTIQGYSLYVVRAGDKLSTIAAKLLGNYAKWTELASLNNIRDPANLVPGSTLLIPSSAAI